MESYSGTTRELITKENISEMMLAGGSSKELASNEKAKVDLLYLFSHPDDVSCNDITPEYVDSIQNIMKGLIKESTEELAKIPPDDESKPAPTGYDDSNFDLPELPRPRTQKFRRSDKEKADFLDMENKLNADLKSKAKKVSKAEADEIRVKGNNFYKDEQYSEAFSSYSSAIEVNPNEPKLYSNRAASLKNCGLHLMSIGDCNKALALDKDAAKVIIRKGNSYAEAGRLIDAINEYEKVADQDPTAAEYLEETMEQLYKYQFNTNQEDPSFSQIEDIIETDLGKQILISTINPSQRPQLFNDKKLRVTLKDLIEAKILVPPQ